MEAMSNATMRDKTNLFILILFTSKGPALKRTKPTDAVGFATGSPLPTPTTGFATKLGCGSRLPQAKFALSKIHVW
jgi:hypothetical protein